MGLFSIKPSKKDPLLERFDEAVRRYQEHFDEELNTVTMFINEKIIADIERCVADDIRLEDIWPELKKIQDEDDI